MMAGIPLKLSTTLLVASSLLTTTAVSAYQAAATANPQAKPGPAETKKAISVDRVKVNTDGQDLGSVETAGTSAERLRVAEGIVKDYKRLIAQGEVAPDDVKYFAWLRRLHDVRVEAGMTRVDAAQAYLGAVREAEAQAEGFFQQGTLTKNQVNEIHFFYLDAEKMLADLRSAPKLFQTTPNPKAATAPSVAGNFDRAFGPADPPRLRRLPKINPADSEANKLVEEALESTLPLKFPAQTPLADVLKFIHEHASIPKSSQAAGLRIYVDPLVLVDPTEDPPKSRTLKTLVPIDFEGVPLRVSLRLILDQFSLVYQVRDRMIYIMDTDLLNPQSEGFPELTGRPKEQLGIQ